MAVLLCALPNPKLSNLPQISTFFCTCVHYTKLANTSTRSVYFPHLCAFLVLCIHGVVSNRTGSLKTATGVRCIRHTRSIIFAACAAARCTRGSLCQIYRRCFLDNSALLPEPLLHPPACKRMVQQCSDYDIIKVCNSKREQKELSRLECHQLVRKLKRLTVLKHGRRSSHFRTLCITHSRMSGHCPFGWVQHVKKLRTAVSDLTFSVV